MARFQVFREYLCLQKNRWVVRVHSLLTKIATGSLKNAGNIQMLYVPAIVAFIKHSLPLIR